MFLYVILCARTPFDSQKESAMSVYEKLQNTEVDVASSVWSSISESAKGIGSWNVAERQHTPTFLLSNIE